MPLNAGLLLKSLRPFSSKIFLGFAVLLMVGVGMVSAQTATHTVPDRLVQPINESARVTLSGTVHPLANRANDRGAAADGLKLDRLQIVLKRSDAQEAELKQAISDMHTPGSASYHKWLTPDDFGKRFGPSDADITKLTSWLQLHGFSVTKLNAGRQTLEITGSAGQFRDTFKSQIHTYQVKSASGEGLETHYANAADPQIPAALAPVFGGFASLNNFRLKSYAHKLGAASFNPATHASKPDWTVGTSTAFFLPLAPADFAVQYNMPSQATAGTNDGTGQSIAIINESNINISLVNRFRTLFSLPANPPQIIIDGNDPGIDGINNSDGANNASTEAYLDVEWAGAVAPAATVNLVIGADTALESGLILAAERAVYSNISPVMSLSFGQCEANLGTENAFLSQLYEQAAAQGITVMVSTGDSGVAGCDGSGQAFAVNGQAVNGFASTPYDVAVGGTDFYYANGSSDFSTYWNLTPSNATPVVSLLKQVPEQPWNNSQFGLNITDYYATYGNTTISGGSGGESRLAVGTTNGSTTTYAPYPKPSWQTGTGVPADAARDIPDVSLLAANGDNGTYYPLCAVDGDCELPVASGDEVQITGVGGTSAAAPSFAGVMALVNQKYGRQGQANFVLYPLATQFPAAFHDVTVGTNSVPCNLSTVDGTINGTTSSFPPVECMTVSNEVTGDDDTYGESVEGEISVNGTVPSYNAGTGYDEATGLGTLNVSTLLADWNKVSFATTAVTLTPSSASITHGTAVTVSGTVTGTGTPTGDVALMTDSTEPLQAGQGYFTLANGLYSGSTVLPGGTYNIWGNYGGDSTNAASSSIANKVQVTVAPEASTTALSLYTLNVNTGAYESIGSGATISYGRQITLSALAGPSSASKTDSVPTGSVAFTNGSAALNTAVLNSEGDAEYFGTYPASSTAYSIKAAYSGDNSYQASTSAATSFTVAKATPAFNAFFPNVDSSGDVIGPQQTSVSVAFENPNAYSQNALAPTGTVTVTGLPGGTTSVTLSLAIDPVNNSPEGVATISLPSGKTSGELDLQFAYAGDNNYAAFTTQPYAFQYVSAGGGLTSATTVAASATTASPAALVQVTTTVTGQSGKAAPTGKIQVFGPVLPTANEVAYFGSYTLPTGSGDSTSLTLLFDSQGLIQGSNQFTVQYSGDANYLPSSGTVTVSNPLSDFQIVPLTTIVSVPVSGTATDTINLTSTNSFAGAVTFTCTGAGGVTCSLNPASATLAAGGSTMVSLTVNSTGVTATGTYNVLVTASDSTGNFVHTLGLQAVVPQLPVPTPAITVTNSGAITIASQGASGTSTVSVTPTGGFVGTVALTCAVTASPTGASEIPTCALTPASISLGATNAVVTATLTVSTTAQTTTSQLKILLFGGSGVTLAMLFFFGGPIGQRGRITLKTLKTARILSAAVLFALLAGAAIGCGGSSSGGGTGGGGGTTSGGTTTGAYTVTITATPATGTPVTTTVALTVN